MIIVKIVGGLGNQMFCYAYAKALEQKGHEVKIDISAFETYKLHGGYQLDKYNIDLISTSNEENSKFYTNSLVYRVLRKLNIGNSRIIKEKSLLFDDRLLDIEDGCYADGYFQCEKYFKDIREILLKQFNPKDEISRYTQEIASVISNTQNSVSLHIRRGDYVSNNHTNSVHGTCDLKYYDKAISHIKDTLQKSITIFVFSDDIEWTKANLKYENSIFIESCKNRIPHEDIYLMSLCHHNIIANSSFSWWGAWLNQNESKIVIAPKRWFADDEMQKQSADIVCESWVRV